MHPWDVLRLNHRLPRDERITTHCALVARIMGVGNFYYSGERDQSFEESVARLQQRWGGSMKVSYTPSPKALAKAYPLTVHLTMYGERVENVIDEIRQEWNRGKKLLAIIGSAKVPGWAYESAYNVAVTNQPHSEVAALALFGHLLLEGRELSKEFEEEISRGAEIRVVPSKRGKMVVEGEGASHEPQEVEDK